MTAARLGKARDQGLVARLEEDEARRDAHRLQVAQLLRQGGDGAAGAHVDGHRHAIVALVAQLAHQRRQQGGRQVVDAVVTGVLQRAQRDALAGTGEAADEDELHGNHRRKGKPSIAKSPASCHHCRCPNPESAMTLTATRHMTAGSGLARPSPAGRRRKACPQR